MRSSSLSSVLLLATAALASPVRQHPLVHKESPPYSRDNRDPYDHKLDTVKEGIQPLPIVRSILFSVPMLGSRS